MVLVDGYGHYLDLLGLTRGVLEWSWSDPSLCTRFVGAPTGYPVNVLFVTAAQFVTAQKIHNNRAPALEASYAAPRTTVASILTMDTPLGQELAARIEDG